MRVGVMSICVAVCILRRCGARLLSGRIPLLVKEIAFDAHAVAHCLAALL